MLLRQSVGILIRQSSCMLFICFRCSDSDPMSDLICIEDGSKWPLLLVGKKNDRFAYVETSNMDLHVQIQNKEQIGLYYFYTQTFVLFPNRKLLPLHKLQNLLKFCPGQKGLVTKELQSGFIFFYLTPQPLLQSGFW